MLRRIVVRSCVLGAALALLMNGLVLLFIRNVWRIGDMLAGDHVGAILRQLTEAEVALPWFVSIVLAAAIALVCIILRRNRIFRAVSAVVLFLGGLAAVFLFTYVNGIPMHIALRALWGLVGSGIL